MDNEFVGRFEKTSEAVASVGRVASDGGNHRAMSYALLSADERVAAVRLAVMQMRSRFGVPVEVVRRVEDVRDARASRAIRSGEDVRGWCDTRSGKVCLYAPNIENEQDARSMYMHEVIAHKGMRGLLGEERYNEMCERLGAVLTDEQRQVVEEYAGSGDSVLGDEYIARIAEELIDERGEIKEPTVWAKIQAIVREIFRAALGLELSDADIRYMLWRSGERLRSGQADMTQRAQDVETGRKLRDAVTRMRPEKTETAKFDEYDGVVVLSVPNDASLPLRTLPKGETNTEYVAFFPNQIKSATDNVGAYNLNNDDVRLSIRETAQPTKTSVRFRIGEPYDVKTNPIGRAEPGLNGKSVAVVSVPRHDFKGTGKEALQAAESWAVVNLVGEYSNEETGGKGEMYVSGNALSKFLSKAAVLKSDSLGAHLAVLKKFKDVLRESVNCESHPDFKKGKDGGRRPENGLASENIIHRLYGAVDIGGKKYRVKTTVKEQSAERKRNAPYTYEVTGIELLGGSMAGIVNDGSQLLSNAPSNSISLAKLLKNVRMSYAEAGKDASEAEFLLDESRKRDEEGMQVDGEGTLMTRESTDDGYVVLRPNQMRRARGDMGFYERGDDGIRFAIGHKRKEDMRKGLMSKLGNASDEQVERTISEIEKLGERSKQGGDSKVEKAAYHWVQQGAILLPEDADKVLQAVRFADKYKVDVTKYDRPQQLIEEYLPRQQAGERIDPDTVKTFTNKQVVGDTGITIYNVANGEQGRKDMREIINTHFGKGASPWCLLQGDGEGNLAPESKRYWKKYSAYPKRVAFKDGKLLAFFASDDKPTWWDRQDRPYEGIPVEGKIPNDELGRSGTIEYDEDGSIRRIRDLYRGNKRDGLYEEWYDQDTKRREQYFKNGQAEGLRRVWYANGRLKIEHNYKDGLADGIIKSWDFNGKLEFEGEYKKGKRVGIQKVWWSNGQLHAIEEYKDGKLDGLRREWHSNGELELEQYFKNDQADGLCRGWYSNGQLGLECNYRKGEREGMYRVWYRNGQIREESHYSNGRLDCLYGRWSEKGRLLEGSGLSAPDLVKTSQRAMGDGRHQQLSFDFGEDEELAVSSPEVVVSEAVRSRGRGR